MAKKEDLNTHIAKERLEAMDELINKMNTKKTQSRKHFIVLGKLRNSLYNCILLSVFIHAANHHGQTEIPAKILVELYNNALVEERKLHRKHGIESWIKEADTSEYAGMGVNDDKIIKRISRMKKAGFISSSKSKGTDGRGRVYTLAISGDDLKKAKEVAETELQTYIKLEQYKKSTENKK